MTDIYIRPKRVIAIEHARDGTERMLKIARTQCGYRWDIHCHDSPWERECPTTQFGATLAVACRDLTHEMLSRTNGRTFMYGGCGMLADALVSWSGQKLDLAGVYYRGRLDHIVATDGLTYLDADGQFDAPAFLRKSFVLDDDRDITFTEGHIESYDDTIARDLTISEWLKSELSTRLPDPGSNPWDTRAVISNDFTDQGSTRRILSHT